MVKWIYSTDTVNAQFVKDSDIFINLKIEWLIEEYNYLAEGNDEIVKRIKCQTLNGFNQ